MWSVERPKNVNTINGPQSDSQDTQLRSQVTFKPCRWREALRAKPGPCRRSPSLSTHVLMAHAVIVCFGSAPQPLLQPASLGRRTRKLIDGAGAYLGRSRREWRKSFAFTSAEGEAQSQADKVGPTRLPCCLQSLPLPGNKPRLQPAMAKMHGLDWLFSIGVIFFLISLWGIGANDVANSYATSVSSKSLTLVQAGCLATITEFVGAIALGQGVTSTIRHGIFSIDPFENSPGVLIMAMVVAEIGSATWLTICTKLGFPVSTTQSIVGALVGVGIAADIHVNWGWQDGSVSQIAASWGIAPAIACGFGAILMMTIKLLVHQQKDPLKAALLVVTVSRAQKTLVRVRLVPSSLGHSSASGLFPPSSSCLTTMPTHCRLIREDRRLRIWHIPMGPLLWKQNYNLYFPGDPNSAVVPNYYSTEYTGGDAHKNDGKSSRDSDEAGLDKPYGAGPRAGVSVGQQDTNEKEISNNQVQPDADGMKGLDEGVQRARQADLKAVDALPWAHPRRIWATIRMVLFYGITRDVIGHQSQGLEDVHSRALQFDNKVEHLWTTAQVCSAMIMSIAHGANDVSNAIGPFTTEYETWSTGVTSAETETPTWIKAVGGLGLGFGFWTFGYHIMRNLGNRITKHSPTRGYSMELAAAITVLLASNLGLPVSTTQCITGAIIGVALTNNDLKSINWKQIGKIFVGWVLTVPKPLEGGKMNRSDGDVDVCTC
ncbi:phosphate transporter [Hortaea werneckii]|nr:phosphate transporter [Hortaea werneckii]